MPTLKKRSTFEEWEAFLSLIDRSENIEEVISLLDSRMHYLGFEKSAYWLRWPNDPQKCPIILSTYPKEFVDHYVNMDYGAYDMVGKISTNTNRPFGWAEIEKRYKITSKQRLIFHDSSCVGLKQGASVPIHGPGMTKATFSVASNLSKKEFEELYRFHQHEIHILATSAHEKLMSLGLGRMDPIEDLTTRETEVITWIVKGLTYFEISEKLCIEEDTIKKHMQNIFRKLKVSNGPHAASVAVFRGIVLP